MPDVAVVEPLAAAVIKAAEVANHFKAAGSLRNRVESGFTIVESAVSLNVTIEAGLAHVSNIALRSTANVVKTLTASATNHIYLKSNGDFEINTTGVAPADSIKLWEVTTNASGATGKTDRRSLDFATDAGKFLAPKLKADHATDPSVEGGSVLLEQTQPFVRLKDTATSQITRIWARSSKLQVTDDAGTVLTDDLRNLAVSFSQITGTLSDTQHGNRGGGALHAAATGGANGFMASADKTKLDDATDAATASKLVMRDAAGRAKFVDGAVASDAATKGQVDTVQTDLNAHKGSGGAAHAGATTGAAGFMSAADKSKLDDATASPTASKLLLRDAAGRAQVAAPSVAADIARKDTVDTVQTNLDAHIGTGGSAHAGATGGAAGFMSAADKTKLDGATAAATASALMQRDAAGRSKVVAPSAADDIARKDTVDTHANLTGSSAHGAVSAATANQVVTRDAAGRAKFVAGAAADDALVHGQVAGGDLSGTYPNPSVANSVKSGYTRALVDRKVFEFLFQDGSSTFTYGVGRDGKITDTGPKILTGRSDGPANRGYLRTGTVIECLMRGEYVRQTGGGSNVLVDGGSFDIIGYASDHATNANKVRLSYTDTSGTLQEIDMFTPAAGEIGALEIVLTVQGDNAAAGQRNLDIVIRRDGAQVASVSSRIGDTISLFTGFGTTALVSHMNFPLYSPVMGRLTLP